MDTSSAMLFPHSCLPQTGIKQILSFAGPLTICEPWYQERPVFLSEMEDHNAVRILLPPESMHPGEGFLTLLQEYREWTQSHRDRGYREFLQAVQGQDSDEESSWAIRQSLVEGGQTPPEREQDETLKRHLILHLARDIDDQRYEADDLLGSLKKMGSPLSGSVEEEPRNPIADLPHFQGEPGLGTFAMDQVMDAWISLFGKYMKKESPLVTINRQVLECVRDRWEEEASDSDNTGVPSFLLSWPDLSQLGLEELFRAREDLVGSRAAGQIMQAIQQPGKDPEDSLAQLVTLSEEIEGILDDKPAWGRLMITGMPIPPFSGTGKGSELFRNLSGKMLILVEGE